MRRLSLAVAALAAFLFACGCQTSSAPDAAAPAEPSSAKKGDAGGTEKTKADAEKSDGKVRPTGADHALYAELMKAVEAAQGTPGQEGANVLHPDNWQTGVVKRLTKDKAFAPKDLKKARKIAREMLDGARKAADWPDPPRIDIPRAQPAPTIDGKLDDPAWAEAAVFTGVYPFNQKEKRNAPGTTWRILWDAEHLYFAFACEDAEVMSPEMERDEHVFAHDCVEMFLLPRFETGLYWEIVIGPSGSVFDALHAKYRDRFGAYSRAEMDMEGLEFGIVVDGTLNDPGDEDAGYTVEVAVPRKALPEYSRTPLAAGHTIDCMLARLDENEDGMKPYAFIPLLSWGHNIWNHATLVLKD